MPYVFTISWNDHVNEFVLKYVGGVSEWSGRLYCSWPDGRDSYYCWTFLSALSTSTSAPYLIYIYIWLNLWQPHGSTEYRPLHLHIIHMHVEVFLLRYVELHLLDPWTTTVLLYASELVNRGIDLRPGEGDKLIIYSHVLLTFFVSLRLDSISCCSFWYANILSGNSYLEAPKVSMILPTLFDMELVAPPPGNTITNTVFKTGAYLWMENKLIHLSGPRSTHSQTAPPHQCRACWSTRFPSWYGIWSSSTDSDQSSGSHPRAGWTAPKGTRPRLPMDVAPGSSSPESASPSPTRHDARSTNYGARIGSRGCWFVIAVSGLSSRGLILSLRNMYVEPYCEF